MSPPASKPPSGSSLQLMPRPIGGTPRQCCWQEYRGWGRMRTRRETARSSVVRKQAMCQQPPTCRPVRRGDQRGGSRSRWETWGRGRWQHRGLASEGRPPRLRRRSPALQPRALSLQFAVAHRRGSERVGRGEKGKDIEVYASIGLRSTPRCPAGPRVAPEPCTGHSEAAPCYRLDGMGSP